MDNQNPNIDNQHYYWIGGLVIVLIIIGITAFFVYQNYWDDIQARFLSGEDAYTVYLASTALTVSVADDQAERIQGLSGTAQLKDLEGKLFIFDTDAKHGIWMKDMLMPLDIIWIDKNLQVVHIEENVLPSSYPNQVFSPQVNARFVLEMNAFFVSSLKVRVGDRLTLPPTLVPPDIKENLQN